MNQEFLNMNKLHTFIRKSIHKLFVEQNYYMINITICNINTQTAD